MIEEAADEKKERFKLEAIWHADLKTAILNAPWSQHKDKRLYNVSDFLDKGILPKNERKELAPEEKAAMWSAAGNAFVDRCKKTKTVRR